MSTYDIERLDLLERGYIDPSAPLPDLPVGRRVRHRAQRDTESRTAGTASVLGVMQAGPYSWGAQYGEYAIIVARDNPLLPSTKTIAVWGENDLAVV